MGQDFNSRDVFNLGFEASVRANLLFFAILVACQFIMNRNIYDYGEFEISIAVVFLGIIFVFGFIGAFPPALFGSGILLFIAKRRASSTQTSARTSKIMGIALGGIIGLFWLKLLGSLSAYTAFAEEPICGLLNGTISGAIIGLWLSRKMILP
ncbi:hypothetical protein [Candidatus Leptofilum sp.]|uniref:hypothetical protein n=1 Tax=Candidatus Leptofilum sp. TaxID=3241576 RepID=UPI003B5C06A5